MKLALIGCCPDSLALAQEALRDPRCSVVGVYGAGPEAEPLRMQLPGAAWDSPWESLLAAREVDAVLVAARLNGIDRDELLRRLAQAAVPTLVVHPACEAIVAYELDMIRQENACLLMPYFPGAHHPILEMARRLACDPDTSSLGALQQVIVERTLHRRTHSSVMQWLVRDMNLMRRIVGEVDQVSALGGAARDQEQPLNLSVNLRSQGGQLIGWSVSSRDASEGVTLRLEGSRGAATVILPNDESAWHLELPGDAPPRREFADWNGPREALDRLRLAVAGQAPVPDWTDACRDLEIADSVTVSLRRGRTIQLHHEQHTEEGSFKGVMAVGGCGLLLLGLLALIVFSVVEGFRTPQLTTLGVADRVIPGSEPTGDVAAPLPLILRLWPVYPFLLFLALQLLRIVFRAAPAGGRDLEPSGSGDSSSTPAK
ncbi:MAG: hypothetical protein J5I93_06440 [Pirellulaceae bacterium]|nr:hypothetical protein [Pirellulaceae bacterium]